MKRAASVVTFFLLACAIGVTPGHRAWADSAPGAHVLVDPLDLRQPVPDPEQGLTEKYDGKVVRFTGTVRRATSDKRTNKLWYELQHEIVTRGPGKDGKPEVKNKEAIVVAVGFRNDEKELRGRKPGFPLTVQGIGAVGADGSLTITDAVIVTANPLTQKKK